MLISLSFLIPAFMHNCNTRMFSSAADSCGLLYFSTEFACECRKQLDASNPPTMNCFFFFFFSLRLKERCNKRSPRYKFVGCVYNDGYDRLCIVYFQDEILMIKSIECIIRNYVCLPFICLAYMLPNAMPEPLHRHNGIADVICYLWERDFFFLLKLGLDSKLCARQVWAKNKWIKSRRQTEFGENDIADAALRVALNMCACLRIALLAFMWVYRCKRIVGILKFRSVWKTIRRNIHCSS